MNKFYFAVLALIVPCMSCTVEGKSDEIDYVSHNNIVWDSPSKGMNGSMPLGNGDIGLNAWMEENGDLVFYISKNDSWGDNGRLLKVGRVRVRMDPSPLINSTAFRQELNLVNGEMVIDIAGDNPTKVRVWVDANWPVVNVTVKSAKEIKTTAKVELWRTEQVKRGVQTGNPMTGCPDGAEIVVEPDTLVKGYPGGIAWYHHNIKSVGPVMTMKFQGLDDYPGFVDTLLGRTFGAVIKGEGAKRVDDTTVESVGKNHQFSAFVLTEHPSTGKGWLVAIKKVIAKVEKVPFDKRYADHCKWWSRFWQRSWINASTDETSYSTVIPENDHTIKIGIDQHGGNKFVGEIGRVSFYDRVISDNEIKALCSDSYTVETDGKIYAGKPDLFSEFKGSEEWGSKSDFSFEVWVKPDKLGGGGARIVDKITPGGSDGLLLDTNPGNSLRLIVGSEILNVKNCLEADKWSHVAVVVDAKIGKATLYLNGKQIAGKRAMEYLDDASTVTRAYALQRFIDACGSRGEFPVKFNGSIFTVDFNGDPDDRRWGQGYWWQNSRLPYISMPMSGDFDLMKPLMRMYVDDIFPLCEYRTKKYFGFEGAYFGECMYPWGAIFSNTYGWDKPYSERKDPLQRSMWHKWEWVAGPELVFMLMDYCEYTGDEKYLVEKVVPIAEAIMSFFENYYKVNGAGKLVMHPSQAVETWIECTNPMPELPIRETEDGKALAPAGKFARKINIENPELYAVYPFRQIAVGNPNIELGINALKHRWDRGASGWRQDDIFMAYLGLTDQVKANLVSRARNYDKNSRFPAFWGPNYDWIPDQDHGGVLMKAFQSMLMQVDPYSKKIYLLPAWPKGWDVEFKLHAPYKTVIECSVKNGKLVGLKVDPQSRRKDVIVADPYE